MMTIATFLTAMSFNRFFRRNRILLLSSFLSWKANSWMLDAGTGERSTLDIEELSPTLDLLLFTSYFHLQVYPFPFHLDLSSNSFQSISYLAARHLDIHPIQKI